MIAGLAGAIDELDIEPSAEEIEQVMRLRDRLEAKISVALRDFDAEDAWGCDGSLSLTAWVSWHARRSKKDAHKEAVAAKRLAQLPVAAAAWEDGTLSTGQVNMIVANVSSQHVGLFGSQEAEIVPQLAPLSVRNVAVAMRTWRLRAEALDQAQDPAERPSELHISETMDGRRELSGHLSAEYGAIVEEAIDAASLPPWDAANGEPISGMDPAQRRADALVDICRQFLSGLGQPAASGRNRPQLNVLVDIEDLVSGGPGQLIGGTVLPGSTIEYLSCDSVLHRILTSGSAVLDYGTSTRTIPRALWAALVARDGHCRHPGCDRPPHWGEGHHVTHFSKGGPTKLDNLVLACARHHHLWHKRGWKLLLYPDATLDLVSPEGVLYSTKPPPRQLR